MMCPLVSGLAFVSWGCRYSLFDAGSPGLGDVVTLLPTPDFLHSYEMLCVLRTLYSWVT